MGSYEILSIGTKLKNLREKYNVRQEDLAGGEITRNLISQIEHGKANLTKNAAEIILKNLKKICDRNHITIDENIEYLMEDEKSQAEKILGKYIKELKDLMVYKDTSFVDKLTEVEEFLVQWNITDKKIDIFELAGDYFASIDDYYKSSLYYEKARALFDKYSKNSIGILRKLSMVYFYMGEYKQDIKCCQFAVDWFNDDLTEEYRCIFLYNSSLCYTMLGKNDLALKQLDILEKMVYNLNADKYYEVILQKAACFLCLNEYDKSLNLYNELLKHVDEINSEVYTSALINMTEIYIKLSHFEKVKYNLNLILKNVNASDENLRFIPSAYLEIGKIYRDLKDLKNAEKYYLKALALIKKNTQYFLVGDILSELLDIYANSQNTRKILNLKSEFYMFTGKENKVIAPVLDKFIDFYLDTGDIKSLRELHDFSKKFK